MRREAKAPHPPAAISCLGYPINFLGLPAISVTCGYTSNGMPTSFQLVGRPFSEALLFRLGHRSQQETRWHLDVPTELRCKHLVKAAL
jgi:aspartyl-tRNA(Asn)/glutamyl-tRNA(Gln) amidotransferase subunit A